MKKVNVLTQAQAKENGVFKIGKYDLVQGDESTVLYANGSITVTVSKDVWEALTLSTSADYKLIIFAINNQMKADGVSKNIRHDIEEGLITLWGGHTHNLSWRRKMINAGY